jgi:hypothetical protein
MAIMKTRLILGAIFSPLSIPILFFLGNYFLSGYTDQEHGHFVKLLQITLGFALDSYFLTFVLGGPLLIILNKFNKVNFFNCIASSLLLGFISGACFSVFIFKHSDGNTISFFAFLGGISAFIVSVSFCLLAGISRSTSKI